MTARTIVGLCALAALLGVAIYLLFQIPWEFAIGGLVALPAILFAVAHDAPTSFKKVERRPSTSMSRRP